MAPRSRFWRSTNHTTVTGLPIYKTLRGKFVTENGTTVNKYGNNWASTNNRFNMGSMLHTRGKSYVHMNMPTLIKEYKRIRNFSATYNAAHPSPATGHMRSPRRSPRRSPSVRNSGALSPFWRRTYRTTNGPLSKTF